MRISDGSADVCSSDLLPLSSFERLREVLVDDAGVLQVELHAEKSRGAKRLQGTVNGELALSCQRCDARIAWPLQIDIDLRLVETEEEEQAVLDRKSTRLNSSH